MGGAEEEMCDDEGMCGAVVKLRTRVREER